MRLYSTYSQISRAINLPLSTLQTRQCGSSTPKKIMNNQTSNPQAQEPTAVDTIPVIEPSAIAAIAEAAPLTEQSGVDHAEISSALAQAASAIALIQEVPAENVTEQAAITPEATPANPSGTLTTMDVADLLKI